MRKLFTLRHVFILSLICLGSSGLGRFVQWWITVDQTVFKEVSTAFVEQPLGVIGLFGLFLLVVSFLWWSSTPSKGSMLSDL